MVSACDVRYATADAFFCIPEVNIGMTPDVGTLQRLPKITYTGGRMPAARARGPGPAAGAAQA